MRDKARAYPAQRMVTLGMAARYAKRTTAEFKQEFPYKPVRFDNGDVAYDMHDVDAWLDAIKQGGAVNNADALIDGLR